MQNLIYDTAKKVFRATDGSTLSGYAPSISFGEKPVWALQLVDTSQNEALDVSGIYSWRAALDVDFTSDTEPMCRTTDGISVSSGEYGPVVSVPLNTATQRFLQVCDGRQKTAAYFELAGMDGNGDTVFYLCFAVSCLYPIDPVAAGVLEGVDVTTLTQSQVEAIASAAAQAMLGQDVRTAVAQAMEGYDPYPDGGTAGQVLTKTANGAEWADAPSGGTGSTDLSGYATTTALEEGLSGKAEKSAVDAHVADASIHVPSGGTEGQVLTKTDNGAEWADAPSGGTSGDVDLSSYATKDELSTGLSGKADSSHTHAMGDITGLPASGGTAGQVLTKTDTGAEWADAPSGGTGSTGSGAESVRHVASLAEYNAICSLASSTGSGGVVPFVALNDIDLESDDIFEPGTVTVSSSIKRGHTYVRIDVEFTTGYISFGGGASATRTVDISTYFVKDFWLVNNSTGSQVDNWALRAWRGGRNILADNAVAIAAGYGYGYGWKSRVDATDPLQWLMNGGWPTVEVASPEVREARLMAYLEVNGTYLGTNPDDLTSSGTNGATLKRISGVWRKGNIRRDSDMNLVESFDMETAYSIKFMYRTSSGSSSTIATPMSTEAVTETWAAFSGGFPEAITGRLQLTGDITTGLPRKAEEAIYAATLEVRPGDCLSVSLSGDMAISALGGVDGVRQTASIDILPGAHTVSAGPGLAIVDAPTADKLNHCEVRWWGSSATLHVLNLEDAPSGGGSEDPGGDTPADVWPTKIVVSNATSSYGEDVSAFNGDYVRTGDTLTILGETVPIWSNGSKYIYGMSTGMGFDLDEPAIALHRTTGQNDTQMSYAYRMKSDAPTAWTLADAANAIGMTLTITEE